MSHPDEGAPLIFDCSIDRCVDTIMTWYGWSPQARRSKRASAAIFVLTMIAAMTYFFWRDQDNDPLALAMSTVIAVLFGAVYWFGYDYSMRRRTRRFVREAAGGRDPVRCEVRVTARHLHSKAAGVESTYDWDTCAEVRDRSDGVYCIFRAGPVFVPNEVFADAAARQHFLNTARSVMPGSA